MLFRILILIVLSSGAQVLSAQSLTERFSNVISGEPAADEILDPDVAFTFDADVSNPHLIRLGWQIVDGYYLYRDKFKFTIKEESAALDQTTIRIPPGKPKEDPAFGKVEINTGDFFIDLPVQRNSTSELPVTLELRYQGCKEDSVCYPPAIKNLALVLPAFIASAEASSGESINKISSSAPVSEQDAIMLKLKNGSVLLNILAFFGFGILLSLTPCVFPMIPILSGIIVGQGTQITTTRAFMLSLSYVLAMASTYAVLGIVAGSFYFNLQAAFQNVWVISVFSGVFVALALSMFGFYELQLPAAMQSRLSRASDGQNAGTLRGAAFMGVLSAIIVGPCVAPPLAAALLYISQTGNAAFGGLALFAMGLGFGVPLLLIGSSAGTLLPKAGAWMETIKKFFGVLMLGLAIWFLERVVPGQLALLLWAALFIVSAVYLGALDSLQIATGWQRLWKGLGVILLVYGVILLIGAASGGKNIFEPLQGLSTGSVSSSSSHEQLAFTRIENLDELSFTVAKASADGKYVMLDFYADWCIECKEMEAYTFSDPAVLALMDDMVKLQADVTRYNKQDRELLEEFDLYGPPAILFFDLSGQERQSLRKVGFVKAELFVEHLKEVTRS